MAAPHKTVPKPEPGEERLDFLADLVGYHLRRASIRDMQGMSAALESLSLRAVPLSVLLMIVENPGISAADICRAIGLKRANIVSILAELEQRGLFLREADPNDNRVQKLFPTRTGKELSAEALERLKDHEDHLLCALSGSERAELRRLLMKVWQGDEGD